MFHHSKIVFGSLVLLGALTFLFSYNLPASATLLGDDIDITNNLTIGGNLGIGNTSPASILDIRSAFPRIRLQDTSATGSGAASSLSFYDSAGNWMGSVGDYSTANQDLAMRAKVGKLHLGDSSSWDTVVLAAGNVGIGNATPNKKLDVTGDIHARGDICTDAGGGKCLSAAGAQGGNVWASSGTNIYNTNTGAVGIGTIPVAALTIGESVAGPGGFPRNAISIGNSTGNSVILMGQSLANRALIRWTYSATPANAHFDITTTGSNPLALQGSGGNVGIGTTNPTTKLDINGDRIRIETPKTPVSSTDACNQGEIAQDANFIYSCVATNTWKRAALSAW